MYSNLKSSIDPNSLLTQNNSLDRLSLSGVFAFTQIKSVCSNLRACGVRGHLGVFGVHYEADNSRLYVVCAKHVTQTQLLDEFKVFGTAEVKLNCDVNGFSKVLVIHFLSAPNLTAFLFAYLPSQTFRILVFFLSLPFSSIPSFLLPFPLTICLRLLAKVCCKILKGLKGP